MVRICGRGMSSFLREGRRTWSRVSPIKLRVFGPKERLSNSSRCAVQTALLSLVTWQAADLARYITCSLHAPHPVHVNVLDEGLEFHIFTHHLVGLVVDVNHILCKTADRGTNEQDETKSGKKACHSRRPSAELAERMDTAWRIREGRAGLNMLPKAVGVQSFLIAASFLLHQKGSRPYSIPWPVPVLPCAPYSLTWALLLPRPLPHVHVLHLAQTSVHSICGSCTASKGSQAVIWGTLQSCSWISFRQPISSYHMYFSQNSGGML